MLSLFTLHAAHRTPHALAFVWDHASGLLCCATVSWTASPFFTSLRKETHWHDLAGLVGLLGGRKPVTCVVCVSEPLG